jgi:hypothetical protein
MHDCLNSREDANALYTWICRAVRSAPLESLRISCESKKNSRGAHIDCDNLVSYLGQELASTLRFLYLKQSFVGANSLRYLCESCVNLEELSVLTSKNGLVC